VKGSTREVSIAFTSGAVSLSEMWSRNPDKALICAFILCCCLSRCSKLVREVEGEVEVEGEWGPPT